MQSFPALNIFLLQSFIVLIAAFILYLSFNRILLKQLVQERTQEFIESEGRFHELVNLLPEIVLEADFNGKITFANERALKRFGISELAGSTHNCFDLIMTEQKERIGEKFINWAQGQSLELNEYIARSSDRSMFPIIIRCDEMRPIRIRRERIRNFQYEQ